MKVKELVLASAVAQLAAASNIYETEMVVSSTNEFRALAYKRSKNG
jgi:hypothetical protein